MSRPSTLCAVALLLGAALLRLDAADAADAAERPNIVWLLSEDNSKHHLKLFDPHGAETPEIARLAAHGLLFEHAFSNAPVCSVARTTLITGCHAPRIGTQFHRRAKPVPMPDGLRMFPAYLRDAGYYTTNRSKTDYNAIPGDDVWDASSDTASWRNRGPGQPFFHKQSFGVTHESSLHFSAEEMRDQQPQTDPASVSIPSFHPDTPTFRHTTARYHDRIRQMDTAIGKVVAELAADGLLEDTFVFYFGDHGGVLPGSKGYAWERGLHVPLVVRVPDRWRHLVDAPDGTRVPGFVSFVDFGPTALHLAGVPVPDGVDGRPFLGGGITLESLNARNEAIGYADRFDEKYDMVRTLRIGDFKYVRSFQPFNVDGLQNNYRYNMLAWREWRDLFRVGKLTRTQAQFFQSRAAEALYDLASDPHELTNLAGTPAHAARLTAMRERLARLATGMPDLSFYPESVLVDEAWDNPVAFGQAHKETIAALCATADLALRPFKEAKPAIAEALASAAPWQRYWALITCSAFGRQAAEFTDSATLLMRTDPNLLVRTRAAEFLGLIGAADPRPALKQALAQSASELETLLILNTVVLLQDTGPGHAFDLKRSDVRMAPTTAKARRQSEVERRLAYLVRE